MDELTLKRIIDILETDPDFFVPVKKLWLMLQEDALARDIDLPDFYNALLKDERFEFTPDIGQGVETEDIPEVVGEMEQDMEALGLYSGPRIKLISREMTAEDIFAGLARSLGRMNEALQNAWDSRPEGDPETEDQLLEILAAGQKLEREVQGLLTGHRQESQDET